MRAAIAPALFALGCGAGDAHDASDADLANDVAYDVAPQPFDACDPGLRPHFLDITPTETRLYVDTAIEPPVAATVLYTTSSDLPCGEPHDVTSETTFVLDDTTTGTLSGNTFTSATSFSGAWGVAAGVTAHFQTQSAFASIELFAMRVSGPTPDFAFDVSYCNDISPSRIVIATTSPATSGDVSTTVTNDPASPSLPTANLIHFVRAMSEGDAALGCAAHTAVDTTGDGVADTFSGVAPSERLCFEVESSARSTLPRRPYTQFVAALLSISSGGVGFDRRALIFPIPPITGVPC